MQQRPRWVIKPRPHGDARRRLDREGFCLVVIRQRETRIHQLGVREREGVEEVLMGEGRCGVCIRKLAAGCDVHVEDCVVEVLGRVVEGGC